MKQKLVHWIYLLLQWLPKILIRAVKKLHTKKRYYLPFYALLGWLVLVIGVISLSGDTDFDTVLPAKTVNDVTQLNPIQVGREIQPVSTNEIVDAVQTSDGPISIGGGRFSMGGQTAYPNSLHIDMRKFNQVIQLDTANKWVRVQAGITWRELQTYIDPHNLSVKIMQTYANFTVGGSVSVNCHGRYIGHGPIISSVKSVQLVLADGSVVEANRQQNTDLFYAAIGGYGGIGVITEVTLQLVDNTKVERQTNLVPIADYNAFFNKEIRNDKSVIFQNGDLYPPHFDQINNVCFKVTNKELTDTTRVTPLGDNYWLESHLVTAASWGDFGKWVRRKWMDPWLYSKEEVVWRNREASYDVAELEPSSRENFTYVLQEYFIPVNNIQSFIPKMKAVYQKYDVNVLNVSLRHAYADKKSYLSWADEEVFAFVIYYKQATTEKAKAEVAKWTVEMTDAILSENGKWYLPYQPHASVAQFNQAYPKAHTYFEIKNRVDSTHRFTNILLVKYNPYAKSQAVKEIKGYYRAEEQTFLTVPEWYLVFNPVEYAQFLAQGNNPSDFPYYASMAEYWTLYERSLTLVSEAYPKNAEYKTMLQVIGVSVTLEYTFKMVYENTVGRVFSLFAKSELSGEEQEIIKAHWAYADFIYHTAWYEFDFMHWVKKVWNAPNTDNYSRIRKWERMLIFTAEFAFKAAYAELIEWGAKSAYEVPVTEIYVAVTAVPETLPSNVGVVYTDSNYAILSIPRWGPFTTAIVKMQETPLEILTIGGNDEIVVSIISSKQEQVTYSSAQLLYTSQMVTDPSKIRNVMLVPVNKLLPFVKYASQKKWMVEHVYDY